MICVECKLDTGKVRGLLCYGCNTALGMLDRMGLDFLNKLVSYQRGNL